jgi:hypothetical protein
MAAFAQMGKQLRSRSRACFAIDEGREDGRKLVASVPFFNAVEYRLETLPTFCKAPIYLRIRPSSELTNLGVRVPLGQ